MANHPSDPLKPEPEARDPEDAPLRSIDQAATEVAGASGLVHLAGTAGAATAAFAHALLVRSAEPVVVLATDSNAAEKMAENLEALSDGRARVVALPAPEASPFDGVRSDRRVTLARAAALSAIDRGAFDFLVVTPGAWVRRCASSQALASVTRSIRVGDELDFRSLSRDLDAGGYLRAPVVEDPGSFAIRGALLDVWPPGLAEPVRIELFGDEVETLRSFDPETQRGTGSLEELILPPAREAIVTRQSAARARELVQSLCDAVNLPSTKARPLLDDVEAGKLFVGSDAFLPAYGALTPLYERIPEGATLLVEDPPRIAELVRDAIAQAAVARTARSESPHFAVEDHYLTDAELDTSLERTRRTVACHRTVVAGSPSGDAWSDLEVAPLSTPNLAARDQSELAGRLNRARHGGGRHAGLDPLVDELRAWLDAGLDVTLTARVSTQADRLATLLEHRGLEVERTPEKLGSPAFAGRLRVVTAPLGSGAVIEASGRVLLTEEEIFGRRQHRAARKTGARAVQAALDDLRSLNPGDFVVHVEHGIGRYLGLEHRLVGEHYVDLLVVEYRGGDKLFLPVYRLNQIQKFTGTDGTPKIDRLGGLTFAKTKAKVKKKVRQMADQLLTLYAERAQVRRPPLPEPDDEYAAFEAAFPHEETPDQAGAIAEVLDDLQKDTVMDRLVCGDVGFGKTEVALRAAFLSAMAGRQVALLCPTTVLAQQHYQTFADRLEGTGAEVRPLSRFQSKAHQTETLAGLKNGSVDVVVGTHRMLSKDVHFKNLGLLVIDEEQRFGVTHKERIKQLRTHVDVLTLSATPIPRTLSMSVGGLRDMSVISTPPQDRRAIRTLTSQFDEELIRSAIERELSRGGQVFYVYNRVEGIYERAARLQRLMPELRIAVGHGKMTERELEKTMLGFVRGDFDVLVATAIVESGLDIPRANTILIDRADMFGLSQLYQLRGRVGRSSERAYCYLLVPPPSKMSDEARSRIEALERYTELGSGFHIATLDMELRGAGELLGADQSGFMTSVGFDLFCQMLEDATAELSGREVVHDVDPELSIDVEALLPEDYVEDVGVRLSLYKRYSAATSEEEVAAISDEIAERFGRPPPEAKRLAEMMRLKTELRRFKVLGCTATPRSVTLHLRDDTPLTPQKLVELIAQQSDKYSLSPDGRITRRVSAREALESGLEHAGVMVRELAEWAG